MSLWSAIAGIVVTSAILLGISNVGLAASESAQARSAADAAALAGVAAGPTAAERIALANGARLVSIHAEAERTRVVVEVGQSRYTAVAERFFVPIP